MTIDRYREIISRLHDIIKSTPWEGHIYCVGGCCRDEVLGADINDIDLAVSSPDGGIRFAEWLEKKNLLSAPPVTYPKFGTAMVTLKEFPDTDLEIVQTRSEKYTNRNSRNPETAFGTIEDDCFRRDFTINSLYYDISRDRSLDITGRGHDDILNHIIRTPVDPDSTFDDDPVRILRCIRLSARFGWEIEQPTYEALRRNVARLEIVSANRMRNEIERMLVGPRPALALRMLRDIGAMKYIMPELEPLFTLPQPGEPAWTVWEHTLEVVGLVDPVPELRFAALLHDVGKSAVDGDVDGLGRSDRRMMGYRQHESSGSTIVKQILRRLRTPSSQTRDIVYLVINHMVFRNAGDQAQFLTDKKLRKLQYLSHGRKRFCRLLHLIHADNLAQHYPYALPIQIPAVEKKCAVIERDGTAMYRYTLPITPEQIREIKGNISERQVVRCTDYLLRLAFENPRRTVSDFETLLRKYDLHGLSHRPSGKRRKKRRR